jgi:hypothetical protein
MASLAHWAAETFSAPQDALSSGAMHMLEAGTYSMADATPARAWPAKASREAWSQQYDFLFAPDEGSLHYSYRVNVLAAGSEGYLVNISPIS